MKSMIDEKGRTLEQLNKIAVCKAMADILEFWSPFQFFSKPLPREKKYPKDFTKLLNEELNDGSLNHDAV